MNPNFDRTGQVSSSGLDRALSKIGQDPKRKLIYHLDKEYGISLSSPTIHSADLEKALHSLVGSGAEIIIQLIEKN
jgi:hypothetical protein